MAVSTGINGKLSLDNGTSSVSTVKGVTINSVAQLSGVTPSNSGGAEIFSTGAKDWTGTFDYLGKDAAAYPGDTGTLLAWNGASKASGSAVISEVTINCDIAGSGNIGGTVKFEGNGALTPATGSAPTDATTPQVYNCVNSIGALWKPVGQSAYATLPGVTQWSLTLTRKTVTSVVAGASGVTSRSFGGYSASGSITFQQDALAYLVAAATLLTPGAAGLLQLYVDGTNYYQVNYAQFSGNDIPVDFEGNAINTITLPFSWSSWTPISGTPTRGTILKMGAPGSAWWS